MSRAQTCEKPHRVALSHPGPSRVKTNSRAAPRERAKSGSGLAALPASPPRDPLSSRGRTSETLALRHARQFVAGLAHAEHIGLAPTLFVTIDWERAGVSDGLAATGSFLRKVRDGLAKRGVATAFVWVRELGRVHGEHVHVLLHVPSDQVAWFHRRKTRWLRQCGARRVASGCRTVPVRRGGGSVGTADPVYRANLANLTRYLLKHGDPSVKDCLAIAGRGPCTILGKRSGVSQNCAQKARAGCAMCGTLS